MSDPIKIDTTKFTTENLPKSKEEWSALREADSVKWAELTQSNIDKYFRQNREMSDKLATIEQENKNLKIEVTKFKGSPSVLGERAPISKNYGYENLPRTKEEWENLSYDDPVLFTDLRSYYNSLHTKTLETFQGRQSSARKKLQAEHPDMYLPEVDEAGQPKKDEKGNFILKINPVTGEPLFNPDSEKGKLFVEIGNANQALLDAPDGPVLLMAAMERRLREKGEEIVDKTKLEREIQLKDRQVAPPGVPPPKKVEVKFFSVEEKALAEKAVQRGSFKSLEEYCQFRDTPQGIYDENRVPTFGGRKAL